MEACQLPPELLSQIFLEVDPHTLYTSIRCLSRQWKKHVEESMLRSEFQTGRWRVGLRVTRKPKAGKMWRGGIVGHEGDQVPGAAWQRIHSETEAANDRPEELEEALERVRLAYTNSILSREGALEDELPAAIGKDAMTPLVHIIPLQYKAYDGESATLQFDTGSAAWHALFESSEEGGEGSTSRLDLDFSIVWRFPGDGQSDEEEGGWGAPDQENGWLSRFYCSNYDTTSTVVQDEQEGQQVLHSSPLARRVRKRQVTLQQESIHPELDRNISQLQWSDEGHEYFSLSLSLGAEFFVRRSARANFLMRRLEAQAKEDEERDSDEEQRDDSLRTFHSTVSTPRRSSTAAVSPPFPNKSMANPLARLQGVNGTRMFSSGASTPCRSRVTQLTASYASVASTPASGSSSPRGSLIAMRSKGPRIVKVQPPSVQSGSRAPFSSANVSGYSSVKHQARVDEKEKEIADASNSSDYTLATATPSLSHASPQRRSAGLSGHCSVPRAHFSAHLFRSIWGAPTPEWINKADSPHNHSFRDTPPPPIGSPMTVWEWSR